MDANDATGLITNPKPIHGNAAPPDNGSISVAPPAHVCVSANCSLPLKEPEELEGYLRAPLISAYTCSK